MALLVAEIPIFDLALRVVEKAHPGEQVEAYVTRSRTTEVAIHAGAVESLVVAEPAGVGVRVLLGDRQGFAWAGSLDPDIIDEALGAARDNATFATPDDSLAFATLADGAGEVAELDLWRDDILTTATADKVAYALAVEQATLGADPLVRAVESAHYGDSATEVAIVSSLGVQVAKRSTGCSVSAHALAGQGGATRTGYGFSAGRAFADLDLNVASTDAAKRAVRLLGAKQPATTNLPVIFDPLVTRSLLALVGGALGGEAITKGRSMFVGREGETVGAPNLTLVDVPTDPAAFGASSHDSEGVPTRRVELIKNGVLTGFLHNVVTGRRAGTATTGSAVRGYASTPGAGARALCLTPGPNSPEEILVAAGEAFYVQSVSGIHSGTNTVSGDFSVGAEGLMVRNGEFAEPIREVTIASTLPRMLSEITAIGSDLTWFPGGAAGLTLLISEMTISGS